MSSTNNYPFSRIWGLHANKIYGTYIQIEFHQRTLFAYTLLEIDKVIFTLLLVSWSFLLSFPTSSYFGRSKLFKHIRYLSRTLSASLWAFPFKRFLGAYAREFSLKTSPCWVQDFSRNFELCNYEWNFIVGEPIWNWFPEMDNQIVNHKYLFSCKITSSSPAFRYHIKVDYKIKSSQWNHSPRPQNLNDKSS